MKSKPDGLVIDAAGLGLCAALTVVCYFAGVRPVQERQDEVALQRAELATRVEIEERLTAQLRELDARVAARARLAQEEGLELQPADLVNSRVSGITELTLDGKISFDEVKPGTPVAQARFTRVPIRLAGTGSYRSAADFLHRLRAQFRDIAVAGFELRGHPEKPEATGQFQFDLVWYAAPAGSAGGGR